MFGQLGAKKEKENVEDLNIPTGVEDLKIEDHIVTEEDLVTNPELVAHDIKVGDEIGIINDEEVINENYRECTCGTLVPLPDGSAEEFTICDGCGIKHIR